MTDETARRAALARLAREGLYDPRDEHDACGVGLVASIDGKPRREVVEAGIAALKAVWHRGAVDADGIDAYIRAKAEASDAERAVA